jgi:hypothetical protein
MNLQLRRRPALPQRQHRGIVDGQAVTVTDYWGEPTTTAPWRRPLTDRLDMPSDGIWKDIDHLAHY